MEPLLLGAALGAGVGGATAGFSGGNPLKGALMGGLTGGVTGGLGGLGAGGVAGGATASGAGSTLGGAGALAFPVSAGTSFATPLAAPLASGVTSGTGSIALNPVLNSFMPSIQSAINQVPMGAMPFQVGTVPTGFGPTISAGQTGIMQGATEVATPSMMDSFIKYGDVAKQMMPKQQQKQGQQLTPGRIRQGQAVNMTAPYASLLQEQMAMQQPRRRLSLL
jgi:hypothetical protein